MKLVEQWRTIEAELPADWAEARLELKPETERDLARVAGLLGPANPGRAADSLRVTVVRRGHGTSPGGFARLLERLDTERLWSSLQLLATRADAPPPVEEAPALAAGWQRALATLPVDWSDLLVEVRLRSSDDVPRASLLCAPLNPTRAGAGSALRFRVARLAGYGASPGMAGRCLERCDDEPIRGEVEVLRVLSETENVATQGPVWRIDRRAV